MAKDGGKAMQLSNDNVKDEIQAKINMMCETARIPPPPEISAGAELKIHHNIKLVTKDPELMEFPEVRRWLEDCTNLVTDELERLYG